MSETTRLHHTGGSDTPHYRQLVSFVRRSARLSPRQQRAWESHRDRFVVDVPRDIAAMSIASDYEIDPRVVFSRDAPLVIEIGSGQGEAVVAAAGENPSINFLAVEVYTPGVAQTIHRAVLRDVDTIRLIQADAVELLGKALPKGCATEVWVFFPDPWHKLRHQKRRLISPDFAQVVTNVLAPPRDGHPGGVLRLATDWSHYADQMLRVLDDAPGLTNVAGPGQKSPRFTGRAITSFEKKAIAAGRAITDLTYQRVG